MPTFGLANLQAIREERAAQREVARLQAGFKEVKPNDAKRLRHVVRELLKRAYA